jgi:hypothetical protein
MNGRATYRGQPLLVLLALLGGWFAVRALLWQVPFGPSLENAAASAARLVLPEARTGSRAAPHEQVPEAPSTPAIAPEEPLVRPPLMPPVAEPLPPPGWALAAQPDTRFAPVAPRLAGGHTMLLAAAFARLEVPPELAVLLSRGRATPGAIPAFPQLTGDTVRAPQQRWSGDAWLLLRQDTTRPVTSGRGSYGQSQAGAVLRYRLAPDSGHRPAAYVRASAALGSVREAEVALGLTARPVPAIPLALAAEVRGTHAAEDTEARPAAFAYTEFPPLKLPLGARGDAYLQGGYVGGRFATPFVDGQVRIDREVARLGPAELRAGAGLWGGAQKGAKRLDVGPGATVALELGGTPVRMSADWRFRVAGEAHPHSGPALTVSTGF